MDNDFKVEIISPEKIIFSDTAKMVTFPSYEGDMSVLKGHISIITFLRPGIIRVQKNNQSTIDFFVEDGTVEYFNDSLVILSASATNLKDITKEFLNNLGKEVHERLTKENITDQERYILNHKLDTIKEKEFKLS